MYIHTYIGRDPRRLFIQGQDPAISVTTTLPLMIDEVALRLWSFFSLFLFELDPCGIKRCPLFHHQEATNG
jgi:hypothetical protein